MQMNKDMIFRWQSTKEIKNVILHYEKQSLLDNIQYIHTYKYTYTSPPSYCMTCTHVDTHSARFWRRRCGPQGKLGHIPQVAVLWPLSAWHTIICNNKSRSSKPDNWKSRKSERTGAKGESEQAFWFIFKDASYCIFNHLPRCRGTTRLLASRTIEFTSYWVESLRRLKLGFLLPAPSLFFNSPVL